MQTAPTPKGHFFARVSMVIPGMGSLAMVRVQNLSFQLFSSKKKITAKLTPDPSNC